MFCNHCGRTLKQGDTVCPKCGAQLGESKIKGGYTSAQSRFEAGAKPKDDQLHESYTKTTFMASEKPEGDDVYTRTTYRPVLGDAPEAGTPETEQLADGMADESAPESVEAAAPEGETPDVTADVDILVHHQDKQIGIEGIDPEVEAFVKRLNEKKQKGKLPFFGLIKRVDETSADEETEEDDGFVEEPQLTEIDDDSAEERVRPPRNIGRIALMAVGSLVILLLLAGGFLIISSKMAPKSPIAGVTKELYDAGLPLISAHVTDDYRREMIALYQQDMADSTKASQAFQDKFTADENEIKALLPASPKENDQLFVNTLLAIQKSIEDATTMDAIARGDTTIDALGSISDEAWAVVTNAMKKLKKAADPRELQGICDDMSLTPIESAAPIEQTQPDVQATTTPDVYKTLKKGDTNSAAVKRMQNRLYELGYLVGKADGDFGTATQTAIKLFQETVGMTGDGVATPEVQQALFSADAPKRELTGNEDLIVPGEPDVQP